MNRSKEMWVPVPGYEGLYEVSDLGRVKVIPHIQHGRNKLGGPFEFMIKEKIIKPHMKQNGYLQLSLYRDGNPKTFTVHRLVMLAFRGDSKLQVNHKNEAKTDNRLANLEYVTSSQNIRYSLARPVESFDLASGMTIKSYRAGVDVRADGFDVGAVNNCCRKAPRFLSHKGLGWRYADV